MDDNFIPTPHESFFIHGVNGWSKHHRFGILEAEVSVSLHENGRTKPLRPYGYVLQIRKNGTRACFDRDATSTHGSVGSKRSKFINRGGLRDYGEEELNELIQNTRSGTHNEIWARSNSLQIVGVYLCEWGKGSPGSKSFLSVAQTHKLPISIVPSC